MRKILVLFFVSIWNYSAFSLDHQSARTLGLARGGRAGALLSDTVTLNPSMLGFYQVASASGSIIWQRPKAQVRQYHLAIVDGRNEWFSAGASWTRAPKGDIVHVMIAKSFVPYMSYAIHGKRFKTREGDTTIAPLQPETVFDGGASVSFAFPTGLPLPLYLALTADNVNHMSKYEPYIGPREFALAAKTNIKDIMLIYVDYVQRYSHMHNSSAQFSFASEVSLGNDFFLRGGYFGFVQSGWGLGGGWVGPRLGLNYGFQKQVEDFKLDKHEVTLDIYM